MSRREHINKYMKLRRGRLRIQGICVDCQDNSAHKNPKTGKQHVLCVGCLAARRDRLANSRRQGSLPLVAVEVTP